MFGNLAYQLNGEQPVAMAVLDNLYGVSKLKAPLQGTRRDTVAQKKDPFGAGVGAKVGIVGGLAGNHDGVVLHCQIKVVAAKASNSHADIMSIIADFLNIIRWIASFVAPNTASKFNKAVEVFLADRREKQQ